MNTSSQNENNEEELAPLDVADDLFDKMNAEQPKRLSTTIQPLDNGGGGSKTGSISKLDLPKVVDIDEIRMEEDMFQQSLDSARGSLMQKRNNTVVMNTQEEDLSQAARDLADFDEMVERVDEFEALSLQTRKRINTMDCGGQKLNVLPQTLKLCFQQVYKYIHQEMPDFDERDQVEQAINSCMRSAGDSNKDYGRFKGEFFAINEPIINKDLSLIKLSTVKQQMTKLQKLIEKMQAVENNVGDNSANMEHLKQRYDSFQQNIFETKFEKIQEQKIAFDEVVQEIVAAHEKVCEAVTNAKQQMKMLQPQNKEQRSKLSEVQVKIQKIDRRLGKWQQNFDVQKEANRGIEKQYTRCDELIKNYEPVPLFQMGQQTKQLQDFIELNTALGKQKVKVDALQQEINQILNDQVDASGLICTQYDSLNDQFSDEFSDILQQIQNKNNEIIGEIENQDERLNLFERRIMDIKISEADQFFLNKELSRYRSTLNQIESNCNLNKDHGEEIQSKIQEVLDNNSMMDNNNKAILDMDDMKQLKNCLKQFLKLADQDLPKIIKCIDDLDVFVVKSLKNQLNEDNKKSQQFISKVKKNYEDLQKKMEGIVVRYGECYDFLKVFSERFENDDLERITEMQLLEERLEEEQENIGYHKKEGDAEAEEEPLSPTKSPALEASLYQRKRQIIGCINELVNQFNLNNKMIREQATKAVKNEQALNGLIEGNKAIQDQCQSINHNIDGAKQFSDEISERLDTIVNQDHMTELSEKYTAKNKQIQECEKLIEKNNQQYEKLEQSISKCNDQLTDIMNNLDMFNPLNSSSVTQPGNKEFYDQISEKIEHANTLKDDLGEINDKLIQIQEQHTECGQPLHELGEREVLADTELTKMKEELQEINEALSQYDQEIEPKTIEIAKLLKLVREVLDTDIQRRLEDGLNKIKELQKALDDTAELHGVDQKKLKYFKDTVIKTQKQQAQDPILQDKLSEMLEEQQQLDKDLQDFDEKIKQIKKKKSDAKKVLDDIKKAPKNFTPNQIDNLLTNLEDLYEKFLNTDDKLNTMDGKIDNKIKDFENLLKSTEGKKEVLQKIEELNKEIDSELVNLKEVLEKFPIAVTQVRATLEAMQQDAVDEGDYEERKEELEEQLEELVDTDNALTKFNEQAAQAKEEQVQINAALQKSQSFENLQKVQDQLMEHKGVIQSLFTDIHDTQYQIDDIKKDIGDCNLPTIISKRKKELQQFSSRFERIQKELLNLKNTTKKQNNKSLADPVNKALRESEFKLKALDKDRGDLRNSKLKELDSFLPSHFENFEKNHHIIKKAIQFKTSTNDSETKLREIEEILNEAIRKLTEQDMDNSTDLLAIKAQELKERLNTSRSHLKKIQKSGDEMDGNTSNGEEDQFIHALQNQMPQVFENIETTVGYLSDIEKLVSEVKQTLKIDKMNDLKGKVDLVSQNIEEFETLQNKLEREIIAWNAQKKLCKRDEELEQIGFDVHDLVEDIQREITNTELELGKNKEKQEENRDQDMVDKDGNKVDIVEDLIRLEGEMNAYLKEISQLQEDGSGIEAEKDACFEGFNCELPKAILDQRKKRQDEAAKQTYSKFKRPPMKTINIAKKSGAGADKDQEKLDVYQMISINCKYRKTIKELLKDVKEIKKSRKQLEEKYSQMRREVFKIKQIKLYKPVAGDIVDEMFAGYLNKAELTIDVQRISASNYIFGTKKILAKIINGKLVIRVGGGYMNAEEFIDQYGRIEMMKMMKMEENKDQILDSTPPVSSHEYIQKSRQPRATLRPDIQKASEFKDQMKKSLMTNFGVKAPEKGASKDLQSSSGIPSLKSRPGAAAASGARGDSIQSELKSKLNQMKENQHQKENRTALRIESPQHSARKSLRSALELAENVQPQTTTGLSGSKAKPLPRDGAAASTSRLGMTASRRVTAMPATLSGQISKLKGLDPKPKGKDA